nr:unnamed protein product [Callosobruchus analis]
MGANTISWYCGGESRGSTGGARGRTASQRGSLRRTAGEDNIDRDAAQGSRDGNVAAAGTVTVVPSCRGGVPAGVTVRRQDDDLQKLVFRGGAAIADFSCIWGHLRSYITIHK